MSGGAAQHRGMAPAAGQAQQTRRNGKPMQLTLAEREGQRQQGQAMEAQFMRRLREAQAAMNKSKRAQRAHISLVPTGKSPMNNNQALRNPPAPNPGVPSSVNNQTYRCPMASNGPPRQNIRQIQQQKRQMNAQSVVQAQ